MCHKKEVKTHVVVVVASGTKGVLHVATPGATQGLVKTAVPLSTHTNPAAHVPIAGKFNTPLASQGTY